MLMNAVLCFEALSDHRLDYYALCAAMLAVGQVRAYTIKSTSRHCLQFFAAWIQNREHTKGKRVPALLTFYWLLLTLANAMRLRTAGTKLSVCPH